MDQENLSSEEELLQSQALDQEKAELNALQGAGLGKKCSYYLKKTGPGFLQSAITLGGGSLGSALFLGIIAGFGMMWLQPLAMIMGVIMLSAIAYVTLSTGERPFRQINKHVSPLLGWGWLIATLMANVVWCLPQFSLGVGAIKENLVPAINNEAGTWIAALSLLLVAGVIIWFYDSGSKGIKLFELILKCMVALVVLSFFGVAISLSLSSEGLDWGAIMSGLIPDFSLLTSPAAEFNDYLNASGENKEFWSTRITNIQRDVMISAFATAVGINMTFLLPYSMLKKGWGKEHRGLARFDLSTSLLIPFVLATACVVIAAASQFHGKPVDQLVSGKKENKDFTSALIDLHNTRVVKKDDKVDKAKFEKLPKEERIAFLLDEDNFNEADRQISSMLIKRGANDLSAAIEPLTGKAVGNIVFGIGVLGMALSTIIILMLISGFAFCELLNLPQSGWPHRIGCYIAGIGVLGPIVWNEYKFYLAVPTSVFGSTLLPIAYLTFFLLMNSKKVLKDKLPTGNTRIIWNVLMLTALGVSYAAAIWVLNGKWNDVWLGIPVGPTAIGALTLLSIAGIVSFIRKEKSPATETE